MSKMQKEALTADQIADLASRGEDVSAYFSKEFTVVRPVYVFFTGHSTNGYSFVALGHDGTVLSSWISPSEEIAKAEMRTSERREVYHVRYPTGYQLVWQGGPIDENTALKRPSDSSSSIAFIENQLNSEFVRALEAWRKR